MDIQRHFQSEELYRRLLESFYSLYAPLEERLAELIDWNQKNWDFEIRRKTPWLENDLSNLGMTGNDVAALSLSNGLPEIKNLGAAVGCLYVLEGSTLGGQMITKLLQRSLPLTAEKAGAFFAGYREQTGLRWREFGMWAEALARDDPGMEASAVNAAKDTFDSFALRFKNLNFTNV